MLATHAPSVLMSGWSAAASEVSLDTTYGYGMLELYACWDCGLVEWYCRDVRRMPVHPHLMTELVDLDEAGPFR